MYIFLIKWFDRFFMPILSKCMYYRIAHEEACKKEKTRDVLVLCKSAGEPLFKMRWDGL